MGCRLVPEGLAGMLAGPWKAGWVGLLTGPWRAGLAAGQGCYTGNCSVDFLCRYLKIYEFQFNSQ